MTEDLERLYQTMYASVVRFLYRKVWDQDRAEDLAQEVFIRAMNHNPEKPRAWIFAVASNLARDEARAAVRRKKHLTLLTNDPVTLARPATGADDIVEQEEAMSHVQTALDSLSARDREVLLFWDAGLSYQEIAQQTGLALGAVGTTLARARRRLVEAYDSQEGATERAAHS